MPCRIPGWLTFFHETYFLKPSKVLAEVLASTLLIGLRTLTSFNCYGGLGLRRTWRTITASCQDKCRTLVESCGISNGTLRDHVFESPGAASPPASAKAGRPVRRYQIMKIKNNTLREQYTLLVPTSANLGQNPANLTIL